MRNAFSWLFRSIAGSLAALVLVQVLLVGLGLPLILGAYSRYRQSEFESLAGEILKGSQEARDRVQGLENAFFVFAADRSLIYSNRGKGKSLSEAELLPITLDGSVVGYYRALELQFLDTKANRAFFVSLITLLVGSVLLSSAIGLVFAFRAAGTISRAVETLLDDLGDLERLSPVTARRFEISELTGVSERLARVSDILSRQDTYKRQWMQDISHDLRTPIAGLRGQLEALRDGVFTPSAERYGRLLSEIERLESMAAGVSELYALESGAALAVGDMESAAFLDEILGPFERALEEKRVRVEIKAELPVLRGDRSLLVRAAGNIVSNALRFLPYEGLLKIDIDLDSGPDGWKISIFNEGPPIPEDQLGRIFDRFFRGENSRTTAGSGLGLNIAREIARRHGGRISAENRDEGGVLFTLSVPWLVGAAI